MHGLHLVCGGGVGERANPVIFWLEINHLDPGGNFTAESESEILVTGVIALFWRRLVPDLHSDSSLDTDH
jgi:hypothetical protein